MAKRTESAYDESLKSDRQKRDEEISDILWQAHKRGQSIRVSTNHITGETIVIDEKGYRVNKIPDYLK